MGRIGKRVRQKLVEEPLAAQRPKLCSGCKSGDSIHVLIKIFSFGNNNVLNGLPGCNSLVFASLPLSQSRHIQQTPWSIDQLCNISDLRAANVGFHFQTVVFQWYAASLNILYNYTSEISNREGRASRVHVTPILKHCRRKQQRKAVLSLSWDLTTLNEPIVWPH